MALCMPLMWRSRMILLTLCWVNSFMFGWDVSLILLVFWVQAWDFVARWAEKTRARGGLPEESLLEVLPNPHAGGHFFPPSHHGGRLRWTSEYRPNPPFPLCSAHSTTMIPCGRRVGVQSPGVFFLRFTSSHFTLVWKLKWHRTGRLQSLR